MTIKAGDKIPSIELKTMTSDGPDGITTDDLFNGKKVILFGLPGAFTPTCSAKHVPGYVQHADAIKAKGVDTIACISVNDAFVMGAWGRENNATGAVRMMADGSAEFTKAVGMDLDLNAGGMGVRSKRYSMLIDDGVVKAVNVEEAPGGMEVSDAETMLKLV